MTKNKKMILERQEVRDLSFWYLKQVYDLFDRVFQNDPFFWISER